MWSIQEHYNYLFVELKDGPKFCHLENFPTHLSFLHETHYVVFADAENCPVLFPYAQKSYNPDLKKTDAPKAEIYCPWKELVSSIEQLEKKWEMKGKLSLIFTPRTPYSVEHNQNLSTLAYYMASYPYGYVALVEQWANLRKPSDIPVSSAWLYKTTYLTFQSNFSWKRAFFPYAVEGQMLLKNEYGSKNWEMLANERCDYLKTRVIDQLGRDHWRNSGEFVITFQGVDSLENDQDMVQFLFQNNGTKKLTSQH